MTTPARYCCSLQQSKRLRELGVDAPSMFTHYKTFRNEWSIAYSTGLGHEYYPAYTSGELGEILSAVRYKSAGFPMMFTSYCNSSDAVANMLGKWSCMFRNPVDFTNPDIKADTESQARAAMLIHLLENNLITPSQVNNQLK